MADDICEACRKNTANRECAHGILCDECDEQLHGKADGPCILDGPPVSAAKALAKVRGWLTGREVEKWQK